MQEDAQQVDLATYSQKIKKIIDELIRAESLALLKLGYRNMGVCFIILFISMCNTGKEISLYW